ncbi:hypothetical protein PsYK624_067220 [Phanerochaete sordida]|uniref:Uncharacterized protein n=1 Tax=Phanerochaete sordida TaxID=48140 RepID=A0A9P3LDH6_9APHY|nr:hypothetical protein PsYK624_067220 [Phanerochaete sordida]
MHGLRVQEAPQSARALVTPDRAGGGRADARGNAKCRLLLLYLKQRLVGALASQFLRDTRAKRTRRRRSLGRRDDDWDYRAPRTGHGASARRAAAASAA